MPCAAPIAPGSWSRPRSAPSRQLDDAQTAVDQTKAAVAGADAQIASANANIGVLEAQYAEAQSTLRTLELTRDKAERDLSFTILRAPYDGVVGNLSVEQGDMITAGQKLAVVVPMDKLYIVANFKETQLAKLVPGEKVQDLGRCRRRTTNSKAPCRRWRRPPARCSRCCRRRTRPATSPRSCSACRCASTSRPTC